MRKVTSSPTLKVPTSTTLCAETEIWGLRHAASVAGGLGASACPRQPTESKRESRWEPCKKKGHRRAESRTKAVRGSPENSAVETAAPAKGRLQLRRAYPPNGGIHEPPSRPVAGHHDQLWHNCRKTARTNPTSKLSTSWEEKKRSKLRDTEPRMAPRAKCIFWV